MRCANLAWDLLRGATLVATLAGSAHAAPRLDDSTVPLSDYVVTSWAAKDGLPSDVIWSVTQDVQGYLWLGTNGGPVRFDGVRFVGVEGVDGTVLPPAPVRSIYAARDGAVWFGFSETGGISRLAEGALRHYDERDGLPRAGVLAMIATPDGTMWAGTVRGLFRLVQSRWEAVGPTLGVPETRIDSLHIERGGTLLVGTAVGVYREHPASHDFTVIDAVNDVGPTFRAFGEDADGRMWVTDPEVGFRQLGLRSPPHPDAGRGRGNQLLFDRDGSLWVATMGEGLWRVRLGEDGRPHVVEKTRISGARTLFEDREGNIWTGSGEGLVRLRKPLVLPVTNLGLVEAVEATADGSVWAATADELIRFTRGPDGGREQQRYSTPGRLRAMRSDAHGTLWVVTDAGLLHLRDRHGWQVPSGVAARLHRVNALAVHPHGGLWISDRERGIHWWSPRHPEVVEAVAALAGVRVTRLFADSLGRLWFVSAAGRLGRLDVDGTPRMFGSGDGLSSEALLVVYEDSRHAIWVGGFDGLHRMVDDRFVRFDQAGGFQGGVSGITEDADGDFWLATASGIVCVRRSALDAALEGSSPDAGTILFDAADGLAGMPISFGGPSVVQAGDGRLWFVTGRGLTSLEPRSLKQPRTPAQVRVEAVQAGELQSLAVQGLELPADTDRLLIDYTALDLTAPLRTEFKYRLEGFDADWIDAGTRRQAVYTDLPSRSYRFHVIASASNGTWSDATAVWEFSIRPAFYQTYWFASLCALSMGVATWAAWRIRLRRIRRQFALLLGERVRLSREIHDTLLQSLVGVALQFEAVSSHLEPASPARDQLIRIRRQVEDYIREARQSIWNLRTPALTSRDLATALREAAERASSGTGATLHFILQGTPAQAVPYEVEEQLLRIGQEAVLNAVRHGRAGRVTVELTYDPSVVVLKITDDGCGFDLSKVSSAGGAGHCGLLSMRERAEHAGGRFTLRTVPSAGTSVEVSIPLRAERSLLGSLRSART